MSQTITATYADGVFKPDLPPHLPPNARVRLLVESLTTPEEQADAAWRDLESIWTEVVVDSGEAPPRREQLYDRR